MSRRTPVPEVVISSNIITDDETGQNLATIIVEAKVDDFSNGFIFLDEPGDLYLLRNAIDDYISKKQHQEPIPMNTEENNIEQNREQAPEAPKFLGVIEGYINTQYHPTRGFNPNDRTRFRIMTSQEIILDLADMVDMELNDVAEAMMFLGYRTIIHDGKVGWLLERRSK